MKGCLFVAGVVTLMISTMEAELRKTNHDYWPARAEPAILKARHDNNNIIIVL